MSKMQKHPMRTRNPSTRPLRYETLENRRMLAVVTVTTEQDVVDINDGLTSLREAIFATNLVKGADEIQFDFGHDGPATILLTQGELAITDSLTITGDGPELLTIDAGNGPDGIFGTNDGFRLLSIGNALTELINVALSGLTLTGGDVGRFDFLGQGGAIRNLEDLSLTNIALVGNSATNGGGIYNSKTTSITDSTISGNRATRGGGIYNGKRGILVVNSTTIAGNAASSGGGGGIFNRWMAEITDTTIFDNTAKDGGGIYSTQGSSGRILNVNSSTIIGNSANSGGGIYIRGTAEITNSTINDNTSVGDGGGIFNKGMTTITSSTLSGNSSRNGGGIYNEYAVNVSHSTISGNKATDQGGGIYNKEEANVTSSSISENSSRNGGGIFTENLVNVFHSTISGNSVRHGNGGGMYNAGGVANIINSTLSENTAAFGKGGAIYNDGTANITSSSIAKNSVTGEGGGIYNNDASLTFNNSIVAENAAVLSGPDIFGFRYVISGVFSLIGDGTGQMGMVDGISGNQVGTSDTPIDPFLGPLADNGGPTLTHALLPGSPAIDAGDPVLQQGDAALPEFDQRGAPFARVSGSRIDIGAYESQPANGGLSGDFDGDGDADGADFLSWQRGVGVSLAAQASDGDATGDGDVDSNDLAVWQAMYGEEADTLEETIAARAETTDFAEAVDLLMASTLLDEKWELSDRSSPLVRRPFMAKSMDDRRSSFTLPNTPRRHESSEIRMNSSRDRDTAEPFHERPPVENTLFPHRLLKAPRSMFAKITKHFFVGLALSLGCWVATAQAESVRTVALKWTIAPGTTVKFDDFSSPVLNNAGQTAFKGDLAGIEGRPSTISGIFGQRGEACSHCLRAAAI